MRPAAEKGRVERAIRYVRESFFAAQTLRKPLLAAVNGLALGLGMELAMLCDITLASESAVFRLPEIKHGNAGSAGDTRAGKSWARRTRRPAFKDR